ncbi:MAG: hypothetical protein GX294_07045 [Candidatus Cloacimonetes bacterium]|nr:hypothetical protein [Candidatus Cloacimonadota bacterium]
MKKILLLSLIALLLFGTVLTTACKPKEVEDVEDVEIEEEEVPAEEVIDGEEAPAEEVVDQPIAE